MCNVVGTFAETDGDSYSEKTGSLCGLGAMTSSSSSSALSASNKNKKDNVSAISLPDLEFGVVPLGAISKQSSVQSLVNESVSTHCVREFDQMCSRTIGGSVGSFRNVPKENTDTMSKEAKEFLNLLPDYGFLVF